MVYGAELPPISIHDVIGRPSLLTGQTPEILLGRLGWQNGPPPGWIFTRLDQGNHAGVGFMIRQATAKGNLTGTMLRWYPEDGRYPSANWKVSVSSGPGQGKFTGPGGQGYPTPPSRFWNRPGTPQDILSQMSASEAPPVEAPPVAPPIDPQIGGGGLPGEDPFGPGTDPFFFPGDVIF
jgi:hypothetical protein